MSGISEAEQIRRHKMMQSVLGTHAMEGMFPDEATRTIIHKYETGEFSMDEFSAAMDAHARSLLEASPAMTAVA